METFSLVKRTQLSMGRFFSHLLVLGVKTWDCSSDLVAMTTRVHWGWVVAPLVSFSGISRAYLCTRGRAMHQHSR